MVVVGQVNGGAGMSAVSIGGDVLHLLTFLAMGFSSAGQVIIARMVGAGERREVRKLIGTMFTFLLGDSAAIAVLCYLIRSSILNWLNTPAESYAFTMDYMVTCIAGLIFIYGYNIVSAILRGMGDSKTPLMTVAIASVCNIGGDLLLVAGLHKGAAGAALATAASQAVSVAISLLVLRRRELPFTLTKRHFRPDTKVLKRIARFGAPIALQDLLVGFSFLVIMAIVNTLGLIASAGVGVAEKVCAFIMLVPAAFMQAMSAYVAQNYGAGKNDRAVQGLRVAVGVSTVLGVVMFAAAFFRGDHLCGIFARDGDVIAAGADYLKAYAIDCLLTCFLFCFIGFYNGLGETRFVMLQGVGAAFLIRIPVAWMMMRFSGRLFHIGLSIPCSTLVQIALCFWFLARLRRRGVLAPDGNLR